MDKNFKNSYDDLDAKQTPSDKLFNSIALTCGIVSLVYLLTVGVLFFFLPIVALTVWSYGFYPAFLFAFVGSTLAVGELFRNKYIVSTISCIFNLACIVTLLTIIVVQIILYKMPLIIPFILFIL